MIYQSVQNTTRNILVIEVMLIINRSVKARVLNQKESGYFPVYDGLSLHILLPN